VAESFFQLLKRARIKRRIYPDRAEARADVFDYIEMFYNPKRRHSFSMACRRYIASSSSESGTQASRKPGAIQTNKLTVVASLKADAYIG